MSNLHPDDRAELIRIRNKIDSVRGPGVTNTRDAISIGQVNRRRSGRSASPVVATLEVDLAISSGDNGNQTTLTTYKYKPKTVDGKDVKDSDGTVLNDMVPVHNRMKGFVKSATRGRLRKKTNGHWELVWTDEQVDTAACSG